VAGRILPQNYRDAPSPVNGCTQRSLAAALCSTRPAPEWLAGGDSAYGFQAGRCMQDSGLPHPDRPPQQGQIRLTCREWAPWSVDEKKDVEWCLTAVRRPRRTASICLAELECGELRNCSPFRVQAGFLPGITRSVRNCRTAAAILTNSGNLRRAASGKRGYCSGASLIATRCQKPGAASQPWSSGSSFSEP
jgi:hypothetical protein